MKQTRYILGCILIFLVIATGCGKKEPLRDKASYQEQVDGKIKVVTTIFPQYDFVRQITRGEVDLTMLLAPGMESHSFDPTPQYIIKIKESDLLIIVGGESDKWVDEVLEAMGDTKPEVLKLMDCVEPVEEEVIEGMEEEHDEHMEEEGDEHNQEEHDEEFKEYDEHVWTSPKNTMEIVKVIGERLITIDKKNHEGYKKNLEAYIKQLKELDIQYQNLAEVAKYKTLVFGDRFPFRYLAKDYGYHYYAAFLGCSTQTQASASTISFLIDKVKEEKIQIVYKIELSNGKIAETICESTKAKVETLQTCHTVTKEQLEQGATYISLMEENLVALRKGVM